MRLIRLLTLLATIALLSTGLSAQTPAKSAKKSAAAKTEAPAAKPADKAPAKASALIDINSAAAAELKAMAGVGDAYSAAIIKGRPYANKTQLKIRKVIPAGVYEKIKDQIIAKQ